MEISLRIIGLIGIILFGTAFGFTYGVPGGVENIAQDFIKERIEKETKEKIDSLAIKTKDTKLGQMAQMVLRNQKAEIEKLKIKLQEKAHEKTAAVIAEMRNLSCECRKKYADAIKSNWELRISSLQLSNEKLMDFIKSKYMDIVNNLTRDLRIFTGINLAVFSILVLASFLKPKATAHLFLPAVLLVTSTSICSYFYLFEQNWFFTILYSDYVGFGYLAYVGVLFSIFCDIAFNKARVTTEIINTILNAIGSAFSVAPC